MLDLSCIVTSGELVCVLAIQLEMGAEDSRDVFNIMDILAHECPFVPGPKEVHFLCWQHCFFRPLPPNSCMSLHASHDPQSSLIHPEHLLHLFLLFRICVLIFSN